MRDDVGVTVAQTRASESYLGLSPHHRLLPSMVEAMQYPLFAQCWSDESDRSFPPFAAAILEARDSQGWPRASREALYRDIVSKKRGAYLAEVVGRPVVGRTIKALGRTTWQEFTRGDWDCFFSIDLAPGQNRFFGHVHAITPVLVRQFAMIPTPLRGTHVLNVASRLAVPAWRWERLASSLEEADTNRHAQLLRDAQAMKSNGDFWDFYFRCNGKYSRSFQLPAACEQSALLEPIGSVPAMEAEARRMHNCMAKRVSAVFDGSRIYFRLRDGSPVNAELVRHGDAWVPGNVLGVGNAAVCGEMAGKIRAELTRLGGAIPIVASRRHVRADAFIHTLRAQARASFDQDAMVEALEPLRAILGKSLSWTTGAYAVFCTHDNHFIQFMADPDGQECLCEIQSHKYNQSIEDGLTAETVDLIEKSGFVWPTGTENFMRSFSVRSERDLQAMAEMSLAILARVFGHHPGIELEIKTHVPVRR